MCFAEIDLAYVDELRLMQPVYAHRRNDLYTIHVNEQHGRILLWHFKTAYGLVYRVVLEGSPAFLMSWECRK